eukprot:444156_1
MPGTPILKRAATTTEVHPNKLIEKQPKKKKLSRMTSLAQRRSSAVQHQPLFIRSGSVENQPKFIRSATSGTPHRDPDFTTHSPLRDPDFTTNYSPVIDQDFTTRSPELESRRDSLTESLPISVICRVPGSSVQSQEKNWSQIESGHPGGQMWSQVQHAKSCIEPSDGQNWDQTKYSKSYIDESRHKSIHAVQSRAKSVIGPCSAPGTPIAKKNLVRRSTLKVKRATKMLKMRVSSSDAEKLKTLNPQLCKNLLPQARLTYATALVGLSISLISLLGLILFFVDQEFFRHPWPYFIYQSVFRAMEVVMAFLLSQTTKYKLFPCC